MPWPAPVPSPVVPVPGVVLPGDVALGALPMPGPGRLLPEAAEPVPPTDCASARPGAMNPERIRANIVFFMIRPLRRAFCAHLRELMLQAPYQTGVGKDDNGSGTAAGHAQEQLLPGRMLAFRRLTAARKRLFQDVKVRGA